MGKLFGGGAKPPPPQVTRMPTATDPSVLAAAERARAEALKRSGRLSTILSDSLQGMTGSSGKLGA